jgi:4-hydroxybenzoate polyprenyltransferase
MVRGHLGDRAIGRRTLALTVGPWPVRIWFAAVTAVLPAVLYLLLYRHSHAATPVILTCSAVVAALSWTTTVAMSLRLLCAPRRVQPALYLSCTLHRPASYPAIGSSTALREAAGRRP